MGREKTGRVAIGASEVAHVIEKDSEVFREVAGVLEHFTQMAGAAVESQLHNVSES